MFCFFVQVVSLQPGELGWLANHMGHDINVHESIYRLQDSAIELAKISRLLLAVDCGRAAEFAGKSLSEIQFTGFISY